MRRIPLGTQDRSTRLLLSAGVLLAVLGCAPEWTEKLPPTPPPRPEPTWLALSQIVILYEGAANAPPEITRTKEEALKLASGISLQIRAGGDYAELARQYSDGSTGSNGGTLVLHSTNMVPAIAAACMKLAVGGVSDPVETKFGFHLIRRAREVEMASARHILVTHAESRKPNPDRTKEQALARAREALEKLRSGVDFADLVLEYSDGSSKSKGGDLGSLPRGVGDPALDRALFNLEVGETSGVTESLHGFHIFQRYK